MSSCMEGQLYWSVELPNATRQSGYRPRRATLSFSDGAEGIQHREIPVSVGKALQKRQTAAEPSFSNQDGLMELLYRLERSCASSYIEFLFNRRDYSVLEARNKLLEAGYEPSTVSEVVNRFVDCHLLDDHRYAETYVRSKLLSGWGPRRIERELKRKGIEADELAGWPDRFLDGQSEEDRAYDVLTKKAIPEKNPYPKLMRYLCSKGFSSSSAHDAVKKRMAEEDL